MQEKEVKIYITYEIVGDFYKYNMLNATYGSSGS